MQRTVKCGDMKIKPARCSITGNHWSPIHSCSGSQSSPESPTDFSLLFMKKGNIYESAAVHENRSSAHLKTEISVCKSVKSSYKKSTLKPLNSFKKVCRKQKVKIQPTVSQSTAADNGRNLLHQESESGKTQFETERSEKERARISQRIKSFKMFKNPTFSPKKSEASPSYLKETSCSCLKKTSPPCHGSVSNAKGSYREKQAILTQRKTYGGQRGVIILKKKPSFKSYNNITARTCIDRSDQCSIKKCTSFLKRREFDDYHLDSEMNACRYAYCSLHGQDPLMRILSKGHQKRMNFLKKNKKNQKNVITEIEDAVFQGDEDGYKEISYADEEEVCLRGGPGNIQEQRTDMEEHHYGFLSGESSSRIVHSGVAVIPDGENEKGEEECLPSSPCREVGRDDDSLNSAPIKTGTNQDKRIPRLKNSWGRLKQRIILKRFIKEVQQLRGHILSLKHMNADERMKAEDWFMDYTLRQIVGKLRPTSRRNVKLLVQAFEALSLRTGVNPPPDNIEISISSSVDKGEEPVPTPPPIFEHVSDPTPPPKQETDGETEELEGKRRRLWQLLYKNAILQVEEESKTNASAPLEEENGGKMDSFQLVKVAVDAVLCGEDEDIGKMDEGKGGCVEERVEERKKRWGKVKKMMMLRRFIKEVGRVRGMRSGGAEMDGRGVVVVSLKHMEMEERRRGEEWMLDRALQRVVAQLSPVQRKRVTLLVEAFETVKPNQ